MTLTTCLRQGPIRFQLSTAEGLYLDKPLGQDNMHCTVHCEQEIPPASFFVVLSYAKGADYWTANNTLKTEECTTELILITECAHYSLMSS